MNEDFGEEIVPDLWGWVMRDHHAGRPAIYAIRRDDGRLEEDHSPEVYFTEPHELFPWEADLLGAARPPVLDVGAGPGRIALWAQAQGMRAVAIEPSPLTAQVARERGVADVRVGRWEELDALLGPEDRAFGTALLMGHNLGLGGTLDGLHALLRSLWKVVRPGGVLLATSIAFRETEDPGHLAYQRLRRDQGRYAGECVIRVEYEDRASPYFPWLLVAPDDLQRAARREGWETERVVDSAEGHYGALLRRET